MIRPAGHDGHRLPKLATTSASPTSAPLLWIGSDIPRLQQELKTVQNLPNALREKRPDLLHQIRFVHGDNLRDVHDASFGQIRLALIEQDISRGRLQIEIGCDRADHDRSDAAAIEDIILDDRVRMAVTRGRPGRALKIHPENITLVDHH